MCWDNEELTDDGIETLIYVMGSMLSLLGLFLICVSIDAITPSFPEYKSCFGNGLWHYLTSRAVHIIPLLVSSLSFILFVKVATTGECPVILESIKGLSLGRLLAFNYIVAYLFIVPFVLELVIVVAIAVIFIIGAAFFIINATRLSIRLWARFNEACK